MTLSPSGIHAVLYALFDKSEEIDEQGMAKQVEYCIQNKCHGITVLGLATEVLKLTFAERLQIIDVVAQANAGRLPLSVTIAGNSINEQLMLAEHAKRAGADWLILQPPMVGNYGANIYIEFYRNVASQIDLPVAIQNAPQYLGRALSATEITTLRELCPNIVAVKCEDSVLGIKGVINAAGDKLDILGGRGGMEMTDCLRAGCNGFVLAPDIAPVAARIFDLWQSGDEEAAETLYTQASPAIAFTMQSLEHLITYGKRMMGRNAEIAIFDRSPYLPVTEFGEKVASHWASKLHEM